MKSAKLRLKDNDRLTYQIGEIALAGALLEDAFAGWIAKAQRDLGLEPSAVGPWKDLVKKGRDVAKRLPLSDVDREMVIAAVELADEAMRRRHEMIHRRWLVWEADGVPTRFWYFASDGTDLTPEIEKERGGRRDTFGPGTRTWDEIEAIRVDLMAAWSASSALQWATDTLDSPIGDPNWIRQVLARDTADDR